MSQFTEGDSAVNRLNAAVSAFEKVLTEPEGTVVEMPVGAAQPSLAERLKRAIDSVTVKPAQAASQATTAAQQAQAAQQSAAQSAADAANSAAATGYVDAPFPDVWAPLNDDLRLLAGFAPADTITVAGTSYPLPTKSMTFSRATAATYIDKSGVLQTAAINTPRFEKEGLLIEGQSTNYIRYSNDPSQWKSTGSVDSTLTLVSSIDGDTKAPTGQYTTTAAKQNMNLLDHKANVITLAIGGTLSASCRVKLSANLRVRVRIGNDSTYVAGVFYNPQGELIGSPDKVVSSAVLGSDGFITIKTTYTSDVASSNFFVQFIIYDLANTNNNISIGETCALQIPQVELGSYSSSFIISGASPTTRAADVTTLQRSGNENYFGPLTYSAEVQTLGPIGSDTSTSARRGVISFYPSSTEYVMTYIDSTTSGAGKLRCMYGASNFNQSSNRMDDGLIHNVVFSTDLVNNKLSMDGSIVEIPTAPRPTPGTPSPTVGDQILIGWGAGSGTAGGRTLNGHIRNLRIWHRALSEIQIKGLR
ncbi:TPA: hypothetical protein L0122_001064 [Citrobacter freundii]|nr:hypothetical protein [Citrobacter freundii]